MPKKTPRERYSPQEIRIRRWFERKIEAIGEKALHYGLDPLGKLLAGPLRLQPDLRPQRAIVVLSGGIRSTGQLNATSQARLRHAANLHRDNRTALFIVCGGPRRPGRPESAAAMAVMAQELGVPGMQIIEEGLSSRTSENAEEAAILLEERGIRAATLVTSALHMRRARLCFAAQKIRIHPAPVDRIEGEPPARASLVSQTLHEWLGLAYYRARTWL